MLSATTTYDGFKTSNWMKLSRDTLQYLASLCELLDGNFEISHGPKGSQASSLLEPTPSHFASRHIFERV